VTTAPLALVPTWRLGALLHDARERDGRTLAELAAASDRFDASGLADLEAGARPLTDDDLQHVVDLYGVDPDDLVPGRSDLVVDLDQNRLATAGHSQPLAGTAPTADEVLASYLSLVYTLRSTTPGTRVPLRDADLDVLARALALATPEVEHRLEDLMAHPTAELHHQSRLLRARVLVPAAGVLLAVTVAGALVVWARSDDAPAPAPAPAAVSTVPSASTPGGVQIGGAETQQVNPDGSVGPPVVQGEGLSGDDVPAGGVGLGDAQVAVRDANGNVVQSDRPADAASTTTTTSVP
jgi:transcriptional regulator with XRE-family HTH domain